MPERLYVLSELTEELIGLSIRLRLWADQGNDEAIQKAVEDLQTRFGEATGDAKALLQVALAMAKEVKSPYDPPAYPDEPLAFRAWRTVERLREENGIEAPEEVYTRFSRINEEPNQERLFLEAVRQLVRRRG